MALPRALRYAPRSEEGLSMVWSRTQVSPEPCSVWPTSVTAGLSPQTLQADGWRADGPLSGGPANHGLVIPLWGTLGSPTAPTWLYTHSYLPPTIPLPLPTPPPSPRGYPFPQ